AWRPPGRSCASVKMRPRCTDSSCLRSWSAPGPTTLPCSAEGPPGAAGRWSAPAWRYSVVLLESHDFAKGTSSRATKLVHGGVRYLAQGNVALVREALRERAILRANAPHLVLSRGVVLPAYARWERAAYGAGLTLYGILAGRRGFGPTRLISAREALRRI